MWKISCNGFGWRFGWQWARVCCCLLGLELVEDDDGWCLVISGFGVVNDDG